LGELGIGQVAAGRGERGCGRNGGHGHLDAQGKGALSTARATGYAVLATAFGTLKLPTSRKRVPGWYSRAIEATAPCDTVRRDTISSALPGCTSSSCACSAVAITASITCSASVSGACSNSTADGVTTLKSRSSRSGT